MMFRRHPLLAPALGWLGLLLLWGASRRLAHWPLWAVLATLLVLAALPTRGLWLNRMLRRRALGLQFAPDGRVPRWLRGGWWAGACAALGAAALSALALTQAWFFTLPEWALLALGVPAHFLLLAWLRRRLAREFSDPGFAWRWQHRMAIGLLMLLLAAAWSAWWLAHGAAPAYDAATLDRRLALIANAPSGLVRWALDSSLSLQVGGSALRALPASRWLQRGLWILAGPFGTMLWLGNVLRGAASRPRDWLGPQEPRHSDHAAARAALLGLVLVLATMIGLQGLAALDGATRQYRSPLALERLPTCERIGVQYYRVGALDEARGLALQALGQTRQNAGLCRQLVHTRQQLDTAVERYLDWYFSLGAEWGRVFHLLAGDAQGFLQRRLEQTLGQAPDLQHWLDAVQSRAVLGNAALDQAQQRIAQVLEAHHLSVGPDRCLLQAEADGLPELELLAGARQRLQLSSAVGATSATFAAVVAGKAMGKASMKAAGKVLGKAVLKQGLGKAAGSAAAGAAAGAAVGSVVPGAGTALGAAAGAGLGLALGVGMDWVALRAEEKLTREALHADLQAALAEHMDQAAQWLDCTAVEEAPNPAPAAR